jgi:epoxyqueuosine reductase QueG
MSDLNHKITTGLVRLGADIVGFGHLDELPDEMRERVPVGISIAVAYPREVIQGISELPTQEYHDWYEKLNERLDTIVIRGAEILCNMGYIAVARTREYIGEVEYDTILPHKTLATRAGIGWIGKSALLVTSEYGSALRLSSILTNAPLSTGHPINRSLCGDCMICANACPAGAVSGKEWEGGLYRDEFFDPAKCRMTASERAKQGFRGDKPICGKCIEICPHTQRYINQRK